MGAWLLLTRKTSFYFRWSEGVESLRIGFWRGVITGSILGAAISMMAGGKHKTDSKGFLAHGSKQARSRAHKMFRGMSKTMNDLIK